MARGSRSAVVLLVAVALVCALAVGLYATGAIGSSAVSAEDLDRVLLVAASRDESGSVVAQIVAIADLTGDSLDLEAVSPATRVTIPGTSYTALADAYPFGGGAGTADALARARDEQPLPYVALSPAQLEAAVEAAGGVDITLGASMNVFDGEELYTFKAGKQTLDAAELQAVFKGAAYRTQDLRDKLDTQLAAALVQALKARPETLDEADTDLDETAIAKLKAAL